MNCKVQSYSVYIVIGGYFVDRFGVRICMVLFASFIAAGQVVFTVGLSIKSWPVMFLGRVIYGFGGESLGVSNSAILADWFKGKELAFAFGLNLSIARLGSVINNVVSPTLQTNVSIQFAMWFGVILCGSSLFCTLCVFPIDKRIGDIVKENKILEANEIKAALIDKSESDVETSSEDQVALSDTFKLPSIYWVLVISTMIVYGCVLPFNNIASSLLLERDYFMMPDSGCRLEFEGCQSDGNQPIGCPNSKWYQPPLPYYKNFTGNDDFYQITDSDVDCTETEWSDVCTVEYCNRKDDSQLQATTIMSIPYIISATLSPFLGKFVDRYGMRAIITAMAPGILIVVHLLLGFTDIDPVGPLVGQGLAYAGFAAVIWPSFPLVVPQQLLGLAYGICTCFQNAGLASFPLIIAAIYQSSDNKYIPNVELFFVSLACLGTCIGVYLNFYDHSHGHVLNNPGRAKENTDVIRKASVGSFSIAEETVGRIHNISDANH